MKNNNYMYDFKLSFYVRYTEAGVNSFCGKWYRHERWHVRLELRTSDSIKKNSLNPTASKLMYSWINTSQK